MTCRGYLLRLYLRDQSKLLSTQYFHQPLNQLNPAVPIWIQTWRSRRVVGSNSLGDLPLCYPLEEHCNPQSSIPWLCQTRELANEGGRPQGMRSLRGRPRRLRWFCWEAVELGSPAWLFASLGMSSRAPYPQWDVSAALGLVTL